MRNLLSEGKQIVDLSGSWSTLYAVGQGGRGKSKKKEKERERKEAVHKESKIRIKHSRNKDKSQSFSRRRGNWFKQFRRSIGGRVEISSHTTKGSSNSDGGKDNFFTKALLVRGQRKGKKEKSLRLDRLT